MARLKIRTLMYNYHNIGVLYAFFAKRLIDVRSIERFYLERFGIEKVKEFYEDNFIWSIKEVKKLSETITSKYPEKSIIITSDHGEAFGENNEWFHEYSTNNPIVRIVPYFIFV